MAVRQIDPDNWAEVERFVSFPFHLYRGSPYWTPPLRASARQILDRKSHPFYRHSHADFFLAERDGATVGRMAMLVNRNYNDFQGRRAAFFGYFDLIDDEQVAAKLLSLAGSGPGARAATRFSVPGV